MSLADLLLKKSKRKFFKQKGNEKGILEHQEGRKNKRKSKNMGYAQQMILLLFSKLYVITNKNLSLISTITGFQSRKGKGT